MDASHPSHCVSKLSEQHHACQPFSASGFHSEKVYFQPLHALHYLPPSLLRCAGGKLSAYCGKRSDHTWAADRATLETIDSTINNVTIFEQRGTCIQGEYLLNDCMMSLDLTGARKTLGAQNGDPSRCGGFLDPRVCVCLGGGGGRHQRFVFLYPRN